MQGSSRTKIQEKEETSNLGNDRVFEANLIRRNNTKLKDLLSAALYLGQFVSPIVVTPAASASFPFLNLLLFWAQDYDVFHAEVEIPYMFLHDFNKK